MCKKIIGVALLVCLISGFTTPLYSITSGTSDSQEWNSQLVDNTASVDNFVSLECDSKGNPHIAYFDGNNRNLKYAKYDGQNWNIQTLDSEGWVGEHNSMQIDKDGVLHISYYDRTNDNLKYAFKNGKGWNIKTIDKAGGYFSSIAIDNTRKAHISFFNWRDDSLRYVKGKNDGWESQIIDKGGEVGKPNSLQLDEDGNPHIIYRDETRIRLKYSYFKNGSWSKEAYESSEPALISSLKSDLGSISAVIVGMQDHELKFIERKENEWEIEIIDEWANIDKNIDVEMSESGNISVSYGSDLSIKLATIIEGEWFTQTIDTGKYAAGASALDYDGDRNVCIAYSVDNELRFATGMNNPERKPAKPLNVKTISVNGRAEIFWDAPKDSGGLPIDSFKIYRRKANEEKFTFYKEVKGHSLAFTDIDVEEGINHSYRVSAVNDLGESKLSRPDSTKIYPKYEISTSIIEHSDNITGSSFDKNDKVSALVYCKRSFETLEEIKFYVSWKYNRKWETKEFNRDMRGPQVKIDERGNMHLLYHVATKIKYLYTPMSSLIQGDIDFTKSETLGSQGRYYYDAFLELNKKGEPHIVAKNYYMGSKVEYITKSNGGWERESLNIEGADHFSFDRHFKPHIIDHDEGVLFHLFKDQEGWVSENISLNESMRKPSDIAMGADGEIHILTNTGYPYYYGIDEPKNNKLNHYVYQDGEWIRECIYRSSNRSVIDSWFTLDSDGRPQVVFYTINKNRKGSIEYYYGLKRERDWDIVGIYNYTRDSKNYIFNYPNTFLREDRYSTTIIQIDYNGKIFEIRLKTNEDVNSSDNDLNGEIIVLSIILLFISIIIHTFVKK